MLKLLIADTLAQTAAEDVMEMMTGEKASGSVRYQVTLELPMWLSAEHGKAPIQTRLSVIHGKLRQPLVL